jgi:hypothetical protein
MNNDFRVMGYAMQCLEAFADALGSDLAFLPSITLDRDDKDFCGRMMIYGNDEMEHATLVLNPTNIQILSDVDDISPEQALLETVYHEWIHFVHGLIHFDNYDLLMAHDGELWDDMITAGIESGFIHRREI